MGTDIYILSTRRKGNRWNNWLTISIIILTVIQSTFDYKDIITFKFKLTC